MIDQTGALGGPGLANTVGMGIRAQIQSGGSLLRIISRGLIKVTPGTGLQSAGIYAVHGGTGAINVTSSGIIDPGAYGAVLLGGGEVT